MFDKQKFKDKLFNINGQSFEREALGLFRYQSAHNAIYRSFISNLGINPLSIHSLKNIPFLPVELFKHHKIVTGDSDIQLTFESSRTSGAVPSKHYVQDPSIYQQSILKGFNHVFGNPEDYHIHGLLPSYLERSNASLVYMVQYLMDSSPGGNHGFYLNDRDRLIESLNQANEMDRKVLLIGVSFALLELSEHWKGPLGNTLIMETGGMKGRGRELTRPELHQQLMSAFGTDRIYSEYGMTELLSQAYSTGKGIFHTPSWMRVFARDPYDPLHVLENNASGAINIIDLANVDSCAFLATSDLGKIGNDGSFEILGRMDFSEIRGCNLIFGQ